MDAKTNFFIKIPTGFFESMSMIELYDLVGHEGKLILLELMLLTADKSGVLAEYRPNGELKPYTARTLRYLTHGHSEEMLQKTLDALVEIGLARLDDDGCYVLYGMKDGGDYVGKDTGTARYMRKYRAEKKAQGEEVDSDDVPQEEATPQEAEEVKPAPPEEPMVAVVQEIYDNLDTAEKKQYSKLLHSMTQKRYDTLCTKYTAERVNHAISYVMGNVIATGNKNGYKSLPRVVENYINNGWDRWTGNGIITAKEMKPQSNEDWLGEDF